MKLIHKSGVQELLWINYTPEIRLLSLGKYNMSMEKVHIFNKKSDYGTF